VATLNSAVSTVLLRYTARLARDSRKRYFVAPVHDDLAFAVFDSTGHLAALIGKGGSGPGEFQSLNAVRIGAGDTVFVLDRSEGRVSVFSPQLRFVAAVQAAGAEDFHVLRNGDMLFIVPQMAGGSRPLRISARNGVGGAFFGEAPIQKTDAGVYSRYRQVAIGSDGTVWASRVNEYTIDAWDRAGRMSAQFVGSVPWFAAWSQFPSGAPTRAPMATFVRGIYEEKGLLWVFMQTGDPKWKISPGARNMDPLMDTIVDVIDITAGRLIASQRFDRWMVPVDGCACAAAVKEDSDGIVVFEVFEFRLNRS
jgi:hypothetical protein